MRLDARLAMFAFSSVVTIIPLRSDTTATKPNLVVIMTDDQTIDSIRFMPNLQDLARSGASFDRYFVSTPLCAPSRSTLLTGQYAHNSGVRHNQWPRGGYHALDHRNTLPVWLREAGYHTTFIGKYVNGYGQGSEPAKWTEIPPGWDDWQAFSYRQYAYYDYWINDNGQLVHYDSTPTCYKTDVVAERVVSAIQQRAHEGRPFFLWVAPLAPHGEFSEDKWQPPCPAPRHATHFAEVPLPRPPSFNEIDVSDKPSAISGLAPLSETGIEQITERYRAELASLLAVDDLVARVVRQLRTEGLLNNTVIIYTSDNGAFQGEHRVPGGKEFLYEEAARQPLIIRGRGFGRGVRVAVPASNVDLAATLVDLGGAEAMRNLDGRSLKDLLRYPGANKRRALLLENFDERGRRKTDAIRTRRYFYAEWNHTEFATEYELYDLGVDPYQMDNRHGDPALTVVEDRLRQKLARLRKCRGLTQCDVTD